MTKEMIFDLQLFAESEDYLGTASAETIRIFNDNGTNKAEIVYSDTSVKELTPLNDGAAMKGVDANGGADTISVESGVTDLSIYGGSGADVFDLHEGENANNTYVFRANEGKDTINGWNTASGSKIKMTGAWSKTSTLMSPDGNTFKIKNGLLGYISFDDLAYGTQITVIDKEGNPNIVEVARKMQGTTSNNVIDNTVTSGDDNYEVHQGKRDNEEPNDPTKNYNWEIDGDKGNDSITNIFNYVSINGGIGNDTITIKTNGVTATTEGVTIRGGDNNDLIDVTGDTIVSNSETVYGGHVYEFDASDGTDTIRGYNANDSIILDWGGTNGLTTEQLSKITATVNVAGDFILNVTDNTKIVIAHDESGKLLGGTELNIYTKDTDGHLNLLDKAINGATTIRDISTDNITGFKIPKMILGSNGVDEKEFDSPKYDDYFINAQGGNDLLTVSAANVSLNAGVGNDTIKLKGGTNIDDTLLAGTSVDDAAEAAFDTDNIVTVVGSYGNDYIDATTDVKNVTIGTDITNTVDVRAGHVYEFSTTSGIDTIMGFNEKDTIVITDYTDAVIGNGSAENPETPATSITAEYFRTGKFFILNVGSSKIYLDIDKDYFKGGKILNLFKGDGTNAITPITADIVYDNSGTKLDNDSSGHYTIPQKLVGTTNADTLNNVDDNFTVNGYAGDDVIINAGASTVSIDAGSGYDRIYFKTDTGSDNRNVTVHGGYNNDTIYGEYVIKEESEATVGYTEIINEQGQKIYAKKDDNSNKFGHTYTFAYNDGHDIIYFFDDNDKIILDENSDYLGCIVSGTDLVVNVAAHDSKKVSGTITLKDYVKQNNPGDDPYERHFILIELSKTTAAEQEHTVYPPKEVRGTTGRDAYAVLNNHNEAYAVNALSGDDEMINIGDGSTINAGAGRDTIHNGGSEVYIDAGTGNDLIYIDGETSGNTIIAGTGNDTIYSNGNSHVYVFEPNQGTNYITNFQHGDIIQINNVPSLGAGESFADYVKHDLTSEGYVITIKNSYGTEASTKIILKGAFNESAAAAAETARTVAGGGLNALKAAATNEAGRTAYYAKQVDYDQTYVNNIASYKNLEAGTLINFEINITGVSGTTEISDTIAPKIIGTNNSDYSIYNAGDLVVSEDMDGYIVEAQAGNDLIKSDAVNVSISAGLGNDTIELAEHSGWNTVYGGADNDYIKNTGNSGQHLFEFNAGDGNDTIIGFSATDTLQITGGNEIVTTMSASGLRIAVRDISNYEVGSVLIQNFDFDSDINILFKKDNSATYVSENVQVERIDYGTNVADSKVINGDLAGYKYVALNGNDTITIASTANDVYVDAGVGDDVITVDSGLTGIVSIEAGYGNDIINLPHESAANQPRIFVFRRGQGTNNIIKGISEKDIIVIDSEDTSIQSAEFDRDDYYVLTLSDNYTKIRLKGTNGTDYIKLGTVDSNGDLLTANSFTVRINNMDTTYKVPTIKNVTGSAPEMITTENAVVLGDSLANNIVVANADRVSINSGSGEDTIHVVSGAEITITGGKHNDSISLDTDSRHVINYNKNDGDDTIKGWQNSDILNINGFNPAVGSSATLYGVAMVGDNGDTFAISLTGGQKIVFEDIKAGDKSVSVIITGDILNNITADTIPAVLNDGSTVKAVEIEVPRLLQGDALKNILDTTELETTDGTDFTILAGGQNDTVFSQGERTYIDASIGSDLVIASDGDKLTVLGDSGDDTIVIDNSNNSTIDAGPGEDVISLGAGVSHSTINANYGDDIIFGNAQGNVFRYNQGDGNDTIYGFNKNDSLMILGTGLLSTSPSSDSADSIAVANPASIEPTSDGLVIHLTDSATLTLKGRKKDDANDGTNVPANYQYLGTNKPDDFEHLTNNNNFKIYIGETAADTVPVYIKNKQVAKDGEPLHNVNRDIQLEGALSASDTIYNHFGADNVTISTDLHADVIYNEGNKVSINGGVAKDVIYLSNPYIFDEHGEKIVTPSPAEYTAFGSGAFDSYAESNTIEAGGGNDTIWGNRQGDYDQSKAHVYKYAKGDGNDVIYEFGQNDLLDITQVYNSREVKFEYYNTKKKVALRDNTATPFTVTAAGDDNGKQWYLKAGGTIGNEDDYTTDSSLEGATKLYLDADNNVTTYAQTIVNNATASNTDVTWVDVDDPEHKNVKVIVGAGSIMLMGLEVGQIIKYKLTNTSGDVLTKVVDPDTNTITTEIGTKTVEKVHKIAKSEATIYNKSFINTTDAFINTTDEYQIKTEGGNNVVINESDKSKIDLSSGSENTINNSGNDAELIGSGSADLILNTGSSVTINAQGGQNKIRNFEQGYDVKIVTGADADDITNHGSNVTISADIGDNTISNYGENTEINTGNNEDLVTNRANNVTINTGAGNDTINVDSPHNSVVIKAGKGNNLINAGTNANAGRRYVYDTESGFGYDTICGWSELDDLQLILQPETLIDSDTKKESEKFKYVPTAQGLIITIYKHVEEVNNSENFTDTTLGTITIAKDVTTDGSGNITSFAPLDGNTEIYVYGNEGRYLDSIKVPLYKFATPVADGDWEYTLLGTDNKDKLENAGRYTTINAGADNDTIYTTGNFAVINAESGNDLIVFAAEGAEGKMESDNADDIAAVADALTTITAVTVNAGTGDDTIIANNTAGSRARGLIYNYALGDGNDVIKGLTEGDRIVISGLGTGADAGKYSTDIDDYNNFIISVSKGNTVGTIKLENYTPGNLVMIGTLNAVTGAVIYPDEEIIVPNLVNVDPSSHQTVTTANIALIKGTSNNDTIQSGGENVSIYAGNGNDSIVLTDDKEGIKVFASVGNDIITAFENHQSGVLYVFGANDGNNLIVNYGSNDSIQFDGVWNPNEAGATMSTAHSLPGDPNNIDVVLTFGSTKVSLQSYGKEDGDEIKVRYKTSETATDYEQIPIIANKVIPGTAGADPLENEADERQIFGYAGADTIKNGLGTNPEPGVQGANDVSIYGGDDGDVIEHKGKRSYIDGGAGNDKITIRSGSGESTIVVSAGNDSITIEEDSEINEDGEGFLYQISGTDTGRTYINGFTTHDTIQVTGEGVQISTYSPDKSITTDGYYWLKIGKTDLYIKGAGAAAGSSFTIDNNTTPEVITVPKVAKGTYTKDVMLSFDGTAGTYPLTELYNSAYDSVSSIAYDSAGYFVDALDGDDYIDNIYENVTISAGAGKDTINNRENGVNVSISAGVGDDLIINNAASATINAGAGNDTIVNDNSSAAVVYVFDNNSSGNTTIKGWNETSKLYFPDMVVGQLPKPGNVSLNADGSQMTLSAPGNKIIFEAPDAANPFTSASVLNIIYGAEETPFSFNPGIRQLGNSKTDENGNVVPNKVTLDAADAGLEVKPGSGPLEVTINAGDTAAKKVKLNESSDAEKITILRKDTDIAATDAITVNAGYGDDTITNESKYIIIEGGAGKDTITNTGTNVTISGGDGNDSILNNANADYVTIDGGTGADNIENNGSNVSIYGGYGNANDTITNAAGNNVTINPGPGNDLIKKTGGDSSITYYFENGNGNTTIEGYNANDTIFFANGTKVDVMINADYDLVTIKAASNTVVLKGMSYKDTTTNTITAAANFKIKLGDKDTDTYSPKIIQLTENDANEPTGSAAPWTNKNDNITINLSAEDDFIQNDAIKVLINGYEGGKDHITVNSAASASEAVTVNAGGDDDTITITSEAKVALINAGSGSNIISSAGESITVEGGDDTSKFDKIIIGENSKKSKFNGNNGNDKFTVEATANNAENANTISGGYGVDEFIIKGTYNVIYGNEGNDKFTVETAATNTTIDGGSNVDEFVINGGTSNVINGDAGDDKFTITAETTNTTIFGGAGNDSFTVNGHGSTFLYDITLNGGRDTITGLTTDDTIKVVNVGENISNITAVFVDTDNTPGNDAIKFNIGNNTSILLNEVTSGSVKFIIDDIEKTWTIGDVGEEIVGGFGYTPPAAPRLADYNYFMEEIFEDSNDTFTTDANNDLSDIDYLNKDTYSTGNIEDGNAENLVQDSDIITASYGKKEDKQ